MDADARVHAMEAFDTERCDSMKTPRFILCSLSKSRHVSLMIDVLLVLHDLTNPNLFVDRCLSGLWNWHQLDAWQRRLYARPMVE
jgi:hypothetical protein